MIADPTLRAGWPRRVAATPFSPDASSSVTLADLDGDGGKEILLVAEGQLIVLRADGTDMPGWPRTSPVGARFLPEAPSVADLDGDGTLEIVTPTTGGADVRHPDGSLVRTITPGGYAPEGPIALADVDGDGQRELVYAAHRTVRIVRADGTPVHTISGGCGNPLLPCVDTGVAVGDLDGDGRLEVAFAREDLGERQYLAVYNADGAPRAPFPRKISRHQRIVDNLPIMADVDGDGVLDVTVNSDALYVTAYTGRGKRRRFPKGAKLPEFVLKGSPTFRSGQEPISAGDLDGDGHPELVVAQSFPAAFVKRGEPPVVLAQPYTGEDYLVALAPALAPVPSLFSRTFVYPQALKRYGPGTAAIGDVDGDGQQDTVIGSGDLCILGRVQRHRSPTVLHGVRDPPRRVAPPGLPEADPRRRQVEARDARPRRPRRRRAPGDRLDRRRERRPRVDGPGHAGSREHAVADVPARCGAHRRAVGVAVIGVVTRRSRSPSA